MTKKGLPNLVNVKTLSITPHPIHDYAPTLCKAMLMSNGDIELYSQIGWNGLELSQNHIGIIYATDCDTKDLWEALPSVGV